MGARGPRSSSRAARAATCRPCPSLRGASPAVALAGAWQASVSDPRLCTGSTALASEGSCEGAWRLTRARHLKVPKRCHFPVTLLPSLKTAPLLPFLPLSMSSWAALPSLPSAGRPSAGHPPAVPSWAPAPPPPVCRGCQGSGGQGSFLTDPPLVFLLRGSVFPGWPPARELLEQAWGHASSDHSKGPHSGRRLDSPFLLLGCEAGVAVRERGTSREARLKIEAPAGSTPGSLGEPWG